MVNPDQADLKGKVGFIFGGLAAIATVVCFFYIPELKNRSFDQINTLFEHRVPPRRMGTYTPDDIEQMKSESQQDV